MCYDSPRVRILMDYRPALRRRTGAGEYVHRLAEALLARLQGPDILTLFSSSWKDRLPPRVLPGARQTDRRLPVALLNLAWHRLEWPPAEWLAGPQDIVQSMHPLLMPARRAAPFITIHDLHFLDRPDQTRAEIRRDYASLVRQHASRAAGIVVPSEYTRGLVASRLDVPPGRIVVCSPGPPAWTARAEPAPGGPILFIGTIEPRKNVEGLLRAYAALVRRRPASPPLILAGRSLTPVDIRQPVDGVPLEGRVRRLGYVDDATREALYREASMLVMPSFDEGFGLPVLEAMAAGVPVVASRRGSLPEVLGGAGLLVEPDDPEGMASAMARVLDDDDARARMRSAGLARSAAYSWDAAAGRLYEAYAAAGTGARVA